MIAVDADWAASLPYARLKQFYGLWIASDSQRPI